MSHGTNFEHVRTTVRTPDLVDALITAWLRWERNPTSRPACVERLDAIAALGLGSNETHEYIAAARNAGFDLPSAVARAVNDLGGAPCDG